MATKVSMAAPQGRASVTRASRSSQYRITKVTPEFDYPRDPKQLAEFLAEVLADANKPKRMSTAQRRQRSTVRASKPEPKAMARASARMRGRLKLRPSLVDYERANLNRHDLDYYFERVYIVARNIPTDQEDFRDEVLMAEMLQKMEEPEKAHHPLLPKAKTPAPVVLQLRKPKRLLNSQQMDTEVQPVEEAEELQEEVVEEQDEVVEPEAGAESRKRQETELERVNYDEYVEEEESRADGDESAYDPDGEEENLPDDMDQRESLTQADFLNYFEELIEDIKERSERSMCDADELGGLVLCMGDYSVMIIEGIEDLVREFLKDFLLVVDFWWSDNRILAIEDVAERSYFIPMFRCYRMAPIYTNEKFPTATPNDPYLMREQHKKVFDKIQALVRNLGNLEEPFTRHSLPSSPYNKLMPDVQRLELVLSCKRYYRTLQQYIQCYDFMVSRNDDVAMLWPQPFNYTPYTIFQHSIYDTNLTFPNYGEAEVKKTKRRSTVDDEEFKSAADVRKSVEQGEEEDDDDDHGPDEEEWVDQEPEEEQSEEQQSMPAGDFDPTADDLVTVDSSFYDPLLNIDILKPRRQTAKVVAAPPKKLKIRLVIPKRADGNGRQIRLGWGKGRENAKRGRRSMIPTVRSAAKDNDAESEKGSRSRLHSARSRSPGREL